MVQEIRFVDINQQDNLEITVDKFSTEVLYQNEKWLDNNHRYFITIYADGFARFGIEVQSDPWHDNEKYVWSSRGEVMNDVFNLWNTPYELAQWGCAARESCSKYSSFFAMGILLTAAYVHGSNAKEKLHYGFEAYKKAIRYQR